LLAVSFSFAALTKVINGFEKETVARFQNLVVADEIKS
jgi:hypothetical protein